MTIKNTINIVLCLSIVLIAICEISIADNYVINNDTVYIDDFNVYLSATPHTLSCSEWVYFNLTSKVYTGNIDACWGFNTIASKPTKAEIYSPHWINTTTNHQKTFYNPTHVVYTGDNLDYGNSYNTNYKYTITESIVDENGTTYIMSNVAFDSFDTDGTNYTIYWYTRHDNYYLWKDFSSPFSSVIHDYKGYNKWYYIKNILIASNKEYTVRAWIDVPVSTEKQFGKYYFAIKPSHETISQAITNEHFYNLDPWWNATWDFRKEITLTGNTSGAQTNYQLLLNVSYESNMQNDYGDLRFCNETHKLDSWIELKVNGFYALIWVEFPTTPANTEEQTYYMYYGNRGAASDWDGAATFSFFDDFPGSSLDTTNNWELVNTPSTTVSGGVLTIDNDDVSEYIRSKTYTAPVGSAIRTRHRDYTASYYPGLFAFGERTTGSDVNHVSKVTYTADQYMLVCNDGAGSEAASSGNAVDDSYHLWDLTWLSDAVKLIKDGSQDEILTTEIPSASLKIVLGGQVVGSPYYGNSQGSFDWIFVRKYTANPPTYILGSEEYYTPPPPTTIINETNLIMSEITTGLKNINMGNYLIYAFILIGILLIILGIQIITNNIYRG